MLSPGSTPGSGAVSVLVYRTGMALEEVATGVNRLSELVAAMASTERGHAKDIGVVNVSVVKMESMTGQNATLVEEAAVASRAMQESASALLHEVDFFTTQNDCNDVHGAMASQSESTGMDHSEHPHDSLLDQLHA